MRTKMASAGDSLKLVAGTQAPTCVHTMAHLPAKPC